MTEQFSNDASTTLNGAIGSADATLTVNSAAGFPATGNFRIRIDNEILLVTNVAGTLWSVTRAVEAVSGTQAAAPHANGVVVTHVLTAGSLLNAYAIPPDYASYSLCGGL